MTFGVGATQSSAASHGMKRSDLHGIKQTTMAPHGTRIVCHVMWSSILSPFGMNTFTGSIR